MSTRNPRNWTEIGDCVSNWQDILTRLYLGRKHQERLQYAENALKHVAHCYDMAPPQTLGELCLDIVASKLQRYKSTGDVTDIIRTHIERVGVFGIREVRWFPRREMDSLRREMYHTHRDPKMWCYHERLERIDKLIDKVKDAWAPETAGKHNE